jgi:Multicopper oxidase
MDGVSGLTQKPILSGETFKYEFTFQRAGTFICHPPRRNDADGARHGRHDCRASTRRPRPARRPRLCADDARVENRAASIACRPSWGDYMTMGHDGMGAMSEMDMPVPKNSIPMRGGGGPFGVVAMGGMFTILKVRRRQRRRRCRILSGAAGDNGRSSDVKRPRPRRHCVVMCLSFTDSFSVVLVPIGCRQRVRFGNLSARGCRSPSSMHCHVTHVICR